MILTLESITLKNFKGVKDATYTFDGNTIIDGRNGSGKSTIADAHFWLWTSKDSAMVNNPLIRNKDDYSANPRVTEVITVDDKRITVSKTQTLNEKTKATPNSYEIDGIPKTEKEFNSFFSELGLDMSKFLYLSNPFAFMGATKAGMRDLLFSMAQTKAKSDLKIAEKLKLAELTELLKEHTAVEIKALEEKTIKEIDKEHGKKGEITQATIDTREAVKGELFEICLRNDIDVNIVGKANDKAIGDLNTLYRDYEQRRANAEKILYQLEQLNHKKNDLSVKGINKRFNQTCWRLWVEQKNGEIKDDCTPLIDGYAYGESTNNGRKILIRADIVYSLQRYFDTYLPVFMDDLESLDEDKYPLQENTQLIALVRRPKEFEIRRMEG